MNINLKSIFPATSGSEATDDLGQLIDQIWHELEGQVPKTRIRQVATGVAVRFSDATVTTNIPLFVHHLTREWLKEEIKNTGCDYKVASQPDWPAALALKVLRHVFPKTLS